jgi:hypothetical protein
MLDSLALPRELIDRMRDRLDRLTLAHEELARLAHFAPSARADFRCAADADHWHARRVCAGAFGYCEPARKVLVSSAKANWRLVRPTPRLTFTQFHGTGNGIELATRRGCRS